MCASGRSPSNRACCSRQLWCCRRWSLWLPRQAPGLAGPKLEVCLTSSLLWLSRQTTELLSLLQRHSRKHVQEVVARLLASRLPSAASAPIRRLVMQAVSSEGGAQVVHGCLVQQVEPQLLEAALHLVRAACSLAAQPQGGVHARMAGCIADSKCQVIRTRWPVVGPEG